MSFRLRCLDETGETGEPPVSANRPPAATATAATSATKPPIVAACRNATSATVADVADVAVATPARSAEVGPAATTATFHPRLELRRAKVLADLRAHPGQRVALDVADAPLRPQPGAPVSVVVACRSSAGIVSAELHIPPERFDPVLFFRTLDETAGRPA